ncbi:MAG: HAD family hydrolase [Myxococcales bacterium]|nr:HAD family hydrolase [Myxococcales bacterium]MCB9626317.1 HAD family hydrolase [Sandaracinaceae bacterium]
MSEPARDAQPTVLLFDIDGTLLKTGGAGRRSMRRAFVEVCGREDALDGMDFRGMTDPLIFEGGLARIGVPVSESLVCALAEAYLASLAREVPASPNYQVMPGVRALLTALSEHSHVALGIGTGNSEAGARTKLTHGDLWRHFRFGGYGDDGWDRVELVRAGATRGAEALGLPLARCRVVVIGDTPEDARAALGIGATCLAVLTGGYSDAQLAAAGSTWVVPDLTHSAVLPRLLGHEEHAARYSL